MKTANIHHVALRVGDIPYFVDFFHQVFGMNIVKTRGEEGAYDSVWLDGGVQLLSDRSDSPSLGVQDHVSFAVEDIEKTKELALPYGGMPVPGKKNHWFQIPQGIVFELKLFDQS